MRSSYATRAIYVFIDLHSTKKMDYSHRVRALFLAGTLFLQNAQTRIMDKIVLALYFSCDGVLIIPTDIFIRFNLSRQLWTDT